MSLALRAVDLERFDRALTTILSPLAHQGCDDWRLAVESSVVELLAKLGVHSRRSIVAKFE